MKPENAWLEAQIRLNPEALDSWETLKRGIEAKTPGYEHKTVDDAMDALWALFGQDPHDNMEHVKANLAWGMNCLTASRWTDEAERAHLKESKLLQDALFPEEGEEGDDK